MASSAAALCLALPLVFIIWASLVVEGRELSVELTLAHYRALFQRRDFWGPLKNSLIVALSTTVLCQLLGATCAYALARLEFRGKRLVAAFILAVSMFPQISIVQPLYALLRQLHLINTYPGLVLPYLTFALPLNIWLLISVFRSLPREIEQAAMLDGASRLGILWHVVLPLSAPGLVSSALVTFVYCWNEFLFALSFSVGTGRHTVPVAVALFRGRYQVPWGEIFAAAVVSTAPVLVLVLWLQRRIVQGLAAGAVKG